jgi:hypothetical protein
MPITHYLSHKRNVALRDYIIHWAVHQEREKGGKKKQEQKDTQVLTSNKFFSWEPEITHHMPDAHSKFSQALSTKI